MNITVSSSPYRIHLYLPAAVRDHVSLTACLLVQQLPCCKAGKAAVSAVAMQLHNTRRMGILL